MAKRSITIEYRVNPNMDEAIKKAFAEVRRKCKNPGASSSQISRAFWRVILNDEDMKKRVICAVCNFIQNTDTSI